MSFFYKYYRPNAYFEKAIRYNELYFAANNELNDPHDLKARYNFEDDVGLWGKLLALKPKYDTWDLNAFVDVASPNLLRALNDIFKGVSFDSVEGSIYSEIESRKPDLLGVFVSNLKSDVVAPDGFDFYRSMDPDQKAEHCVLWLSALLARAVSFVCYSVSFSDQAFSPMMWAHYADGFKGCVVIYNKYKSNSIGLKRNLFDAGLLRFEFSKVNYSDGEKRIPVLGCAVSSGQEAVGVFRQKSAFWNYEAEHRLFCFESYDPTHHSIVKEKRSSLRERIFHHQTNDIAGVIFGPRCSDQFKRKVDLTLLDNRRRAGNKPFVLLDTELTHDSRVRVSGAKVQCCPVVPGQPPSAEGMHRVIPEEKLKSFLEDNGIFQD